MGHRYSMSWRKHLVFTLPFLKLVFNEFLKWFLYQTSCYRSALSLGTVDTLCAYSL